MARQQIVNAVQSQQYGEREVIVRVNGLQTEWAANDLQAVANSGAHAVLLPKVESPETIIKAAALLDKAGAPATQTIWIMAETPRGILNIQQIADTSPRLACIVMGTSDLAKDMRVLPTPNREPLLTALSLCVMAARAADIGIIDGVQLDLNDEDSLLRVCQQGRELGFDGKTLIHPKQIAAANAAFAPASGEVAQARKIVEAWNEARTQGKGVCVVDGQLVENLHYAQAQRTLDIEALIVRTDESLTS